jgi:hypothetical protein
MAAAPLNPVPVRWMQRSQSAPTRLQAEADFGLEHPGFLMHSATGHGCRSESFDSWILHFMADPWLKGRAFQLSPTVPVLELERNLLHMRLSFFRHQRQVLRERRRYGFAFRDHEEQLVRDSSTEQLVRELTLERNLLLQRLERIRE